MKFYPPAGNKYFLGMFAGMILGMGIGALYDYLHPKQTLPSNQQVYTVFTQQNATTNGDVSVQSTSEYQGKFLHKLAGKVFEFLKKKEKTENKSDLIEWLQHKFSNTTSESEEGKKFKDVCSKQLKHEPKPIDDYTYPVNVHESRLCFMGKGGTDGELSDETYYGNLNFGGTDENSPYLDLHGNINWGKTNYDFGKEFKNKYTNAETDSKIVESKFEEGYNGAYSTESKHYSKKIKDFLSGS